MPVHSENVGRVESKRDKCAPAHISYLSGKMLKFYSTRLKTKSILSDNAKRYEVLKEVFEGRFGRKHDLQNGIRFAVAIKWEKGKEISNFIEKACKAYG